MDPTDNGQPIDQFDPNNPGMGGGGGPSDTPAFNPESLPPPTASGVLQPIAPPPQPEAVPLDLVPKAAGPKQIDLTSPAPAVTPTADAAWSMAHKFAFVTGTPAGDIFSRLMMGQEQDMKQEVAFEEDQKANNDRLDVLQQYARARTAAGATNDLTPTEIDAISSLSEPIMHDPNTVLNQLMAQNAIKTIYPEGNSVRQEAADQSMHVEMSMQDASEDQIAVNDHANDLLYKLTDAQSKKGFIAQGTDFLGDIIPFVSQLNRHDAVPGTVGSSFWTSQDTIHQYNQIRRQPTLALQAKALDDAVTLIASHNQLDAIAFLRGFLHYGTTDQFLDTVMNVSDIATVVAPLGKMVYKGMIADAAKASEAEQAARFSASAGGKTAPSAPEEVLHEVDGGFLTSEGRVVDRSEADAIRDGTSKHVPVQGDVRIIDTNHPVPIHEETARGDVNSQYGETGIPTKFTDGVIGGANQTFANASKDTIKALAASPTIDAVEVAARSGQLDLAVAGRAAEKLANVGDDPFALGAELRRSLPTLWNIPEALGVNKGYATARVYIDNIIERMEANYADFAKGVNGLVTRTLSGEGLKSAIEAGRSALINDIGKMGLSDAVIGESVILPEQTAGGVAFNVLHMGRPGGGAFHNPKEAEAWLNFYGMPGKIEDGYGPMWTFGKAADGTTVEQIGQGFYISIARPVRETGIASVYGTRVETTNITPQSWFKTWLDSYGWTQFMTPSSRLSVEQNGMRATTLNRMTEVQRLVSAPWKNAIAPLGKRDRDEITRFVDFMTREQGVKNGVAYKGVEFHSQGDFEVKFEQTFKHRPSPAQSAAYWGWKQTKQMEYYIRNLEQYSSHAREGSEMLKIGRDTPWVEGRVQKFEDIPWDDRTMNLAMIDDKGKMTQNLGMYRKIEDIKAAVKEAVDNGAEVLQMADPRNPGHTDIHYVITKAAQHKPLTFSLIPYKEGGHVIYDYGHYVKQAVTSTGADGVFHHYGDNTVIPTTTRAEALQHVATLEEARRIYNTGDMKALESFIQLHPPFNAEDLVNKFRNGTLDKNIPFVAVRAGESSLQTKAIQDLIGKQKVAQSWADSRLNYLKNVNKQFLGHAGWDVAPVQQLGSEVNPIFEFAKPRLIDPLPALAHGMNSAVRNKFFGQYQIRSAEHFIEEFHSVLVGGQNEQELARLRENPLRALYNASFNVGTENKGLLAAARSYQNAALNLIGTQTDQGRWFQHVESYLLDQVYNKAGSAAANWTYEKIASRLNPISFARQVAFHTKLGLFNPVQLLLQAQTSAISMGILGPTHGFKGMSGYALARLLHVGETPENIEHFAGLAAKTGWKAEDFKAAYGMMIDNGVFNSGNQLAWRWDAGDSMMFKSRLGAFLDKGDWAFNEGNRINRMVAFMGTFSEWRAKNPFKAIDEGVVQQIMARYDDVSINMTHASASALNRGMLSVPAQFLSWQMRLTELMLSKRLTPVEKLRTFAVMSAMYGIPSAVGAWTLGGGEQTIFQGLSQIGVPVPKELTVGSAYNDMRSWVLANKVQNNLFIESLSEGIPEMLLHLATGTQFNVAPRMGPDTGSLWDTINQSPHPAELFLGPSGSIGGSIVRAVYPILGDVASFITGQGLPAITVPDILDAVSNVSTISGGEKAYFAIHLGVYMNQNAQLVDKDMNTTEGLMMGLLGLTPARVTDRNIMNEATASAVQAQTAARTEAEKFIRLWARETDPKLKTEYAQRAHLWIVAGGFNPQESARISQAALNGTTTLESQATKKFTTAVGN